MKVSQIIDYYAAKHPELHRELVSTRVLSYLSENNVKFYNEMSSNEFFNKHCKKLNVSMESLSKTHGYKR